MHRRDFYYRQLVAEADLDEVFDLAEDADRAMMSDLGLIGVLSGLELSEANVPDLTVECSEGVAYDQDGQRCYAPSTQEIDVSVDSDGVTTTVAGVGNKKWVSVFIRFERALSNVKVDGNSQNVSYNRAESFEFVVVQSAEDVAPSRPALLSDALLLADIERTNGVSAIENSAIDITRRQMAFKVSAGSYSIAEGTPEEAVGEMLTIFNTYVTGLAASTGAAQVGYAGGGAWADGTLNAATTVEAQLDKIVTDLAGTGGAAKIGVDDTVTLEADNVAAALTELDTKKGGLGDNNPWTGTNTFAAATTTNGSMTANGSMTCANGLTVVPTSGQKYLKLRSLPAAAPEDLHTLYFRVDASFAAGAVSVTIIPAGDIPDDIHGLLDLNLTFTTANPSVATYQHWALVIRKTAGSVVMTGGSETTGLGADFSGSGGDAATSVTWENSGGALNLKFTAAAIGDVTVSGSLQLTAF